jgi:hypothetical protein
MTEILQDRAASKEINTDKNCDKEYNMRHVFTTMLMELRPTNVIQIYCKNDNEKSNSNCGN